VDSCATSTTSVSFTNLQWKNATTNTSFGTITEYEYSVPAGWKVNGSTSTGPTDLKVDDNTVSIEADILENGQILVRPANKCASGLTSGGNWAVINIVRKKPALTFTSATAICTNASFEAGNLPSWVTTFAWSADPSSLFNFALSTSNPTTVSRNFSGQGKVGLLISGAGCPVSFFYNNQEITGAPKLAGGPPTFTTDLMLYDGTSGSLNEVCLDVENYIPFFTHGHTYNTFPSWSYVSQVGSPQPSWNGGDSSDIYVYFFRSQQISLVLSVQQIVAAQVLIPLDSSKYHALA
jgi:hypothetical protein